MAKTFNEIDSQAINLIGKGTRITGDIHSEGDIRIDGDLAGSVQSTGGRVVIGASGKVAGNVNCKNCEISGFVEGNLYIEQLLSLKSSARVKGDVISGKLSIEPGSLFSGSCKMSQEVKHEV
ncbi:MAG: polymer-forming cytoskeletal protein [Mangrovibacterium sp.]|nr:polymer-forming cytoskeletal protein [Mangrovibacterium sp.]